MILKFAASDDLKKFYRHRMRRFVKCVYAHARFFLTVGILVWPYGGHFQGCEESNPQRYKCKQELMDF